MWQPSNGQWWVLALVALFIALAWPSNDEKSLGMKIVNWAVDPRQQLPILPEQLPISEDHEVAAVEAHDLQVRMWDEIYDRGGVGRLRLQLKTANDPFDSGTERQVLALFGVATAFVVWRYGGTKK